MELRPLQFASYFATAKNLLQATRKPTNVTELNSTDKNHKKMGGKQECEQTL
jgi:hypothetical protein